MIYPHEESYPEDEDWWDRENDEWSEEADYRALAEYFEEEYQKLMRMDCE